MDWQKIRNTEPDIKNQKLIAVLKLLNFFFLICCSIFKKNEGLVGIVYPGTLIIMILYAERR